MIRQLFHAMSVRERFLLALFIWALILVWLLVVIDSFGNSLTQFKDNRETLELFAQRIEQSDEAQAALDKARSGLDSSKTFNSAQLVGRLDSIARETDLNSFDIRTPSTMETELFSFHSVRLGVKRARLDELIRFDQAVKQFSPYIALTEFQLNANTRDPRYLDAVFEFVSFELKEDAIDD